MLAISMHDVPEFQTLPRSDGTDSMMDETFLRSNAVPHDAKILHLDSDFLQSMTTGHERPP